MKKKSLQEKLVEEIEQEDLYCMISPSSKELLDGDDETTVCSNRS